MKHKAYIFDFDGTLVQSNAIKREAFYRLSPEIVQHKEIVDRVLDAIPEKSRFEIVNEIYKGINTAGSNQYADSSVKAAIQNYSTAVREGVLACPELKSASSLLQALKKSGKLVYISSNTPKESLGELITGRKWNGLIDGYFGFPSLKSDTVRVILNQHALQPEEIIVIGDGTSDEVSARENACAFYKIENENSLFEFFTALTNSNSYV